MEQVGLAGMEKLMNKCYLEPSTKELQHTVMTAFQMPAGFPLMYFESALLACVMCENSYEYRFWGGCISIVENYCVLHISLYL